ncbi:MAG: hypothetical protein WC402_03190 [Candidatus Pacearchaeota archaeon]|jgi:hypothetical protein
MLKELFRKRKKHTFFVVLLIVVVLLIFIGLLVKLNYISDKGQTDSSVKFKEAIEKQYPELKDFEIQDSFAGTKIKTDIIEGERYYVYLTLGSGVPIAKATCFRVDSDFKVYRVGEFPNSLDSYIGYTDVNPLDCKGIK